MIIVFPFAARSLGPVVEIIIPPTTIDRTAIVVVAMSRYFPIFARMSFKFCFAPPLYGLFDGLRNFGSSLKLVLVISFGRQEAGDVHLGADASSDLSVHVPVFGSIFPLATSDAVSWGVRSPTSLHVRGSIFFSIIRDVASSSVKADEGLDVVGAGVPSMPTGLGLDGSILPGAGVVGAGVVFLSESGLMGIDIGSATTGVVVSSEGAGGSLADGRDGS